MPELLTVVIGALELFLCSLMDFDGWPLPSVQTIRWSVFLLPVVGERIQPAYGVTTVLLLSYFSIPPLRSYWQTYFLPVFSVHCRFSQILLRPKPFPQYSLLDVSVFSIEVPRVSLSLWHITWDQTYLCSFYSSCMADLLEIHFFLIFSNSRIVKMLPYKMSSPGQ